MSTTNSKILDEAIESMQKNAKGPDRNRKISDLEKDKLYWLKMLTGDFKTLDDDIKKLKREVKKVDSWPQHQDDIKMFKVHADVLENHLSAIMKYQRTIDGKKVRKEE